MHCPNCGTETASEQRFCRSCGLNLEKIAVLVAEQLPAIRASDHIDSRKAEWQALAERAGFGLLLCGGAIAIVALCWKIVSQLIIAKGEYLSGGLLLALIIGVVGGGALLGLANSASAAKLKSRTSPQPGALPEAGPTGKLLPEPGLEPVPSVTERTTEFLTVNKKSGGSQ